MPVRLILLGSIGRTLSCSRNVTACSPPSAFRPISLQNYNMKIVYKTLTSRLQGQIANIVDADQSGFIAGRSISENFVYATKMIQCCAKRKAPAHHYRKMALCRRCGPMPTAKGRGRRRSPWTPRAIETPSA